MEFHRTHNVKGNGRPPADYFCPHPKFKIENEIENQMPRENHQPGADFSETIPNPAVVIHKWNCFQCGNTFRQRLE